MHIIITELIEINRGGIPKLQGTWVHRKVAIHLAQWISPSFSVQVSNWVEQLLLTGKVELGKEMTNKQLEQHSIPQILDLSPYLNKDCTYIGTFNPIGYEAEYDTHYFIKLGRTIDIVNRFKSHGSCKKIRNFNLIKVFSHTNGIQSNYHENFMLKMVKEAGLELNYCNQKELMRIPKTQLDMFIDRIQTQHDITKKAQQQPCNIDKFSSLFENNKITFEQYKQLIEVSK